MAAGRGRSRRVRIPGVQELLRPVAPEPAGSDERPATGREKHDHKITVYLSSAELLDLEHARLALHRFGLVIDRGRLVREAIAVLLADLDTRGKDSLLARRIGTRAAPHPHSGEEAVTDGTVPADDTMHADGTVPADGTAPGGTGEPIPSLM